MSDFNTSECRLFPRVHVTKTSLEDYALHECEFRLAAHPEGAIGLICGALGSDGRNTVWLAPDDAQTLLAQLQDALGAAEKPAGPLTAPWPYPAPTMPRTVPRTVPNPYTPWAPGKFTCGIGDGTGPGRLLSPAGEGATESRTMPRTLWLLRNDEFVTSDGKERWCPRTEQWVEVGEAESPANLDDCS